MDARHIEPVSGVTGEFVSGVHPVCTGLAVTMEGSAGYVDPVPGVSIPSAVRSHSA